MDFHFKIFLTAALLVFHMNVFAESSAVQTYNKIKPLIFQVKTSSNKNLEKSSYGTGFVVDKSGLIVTNYHVVSQAIWKNENLKVFVVIDKQNIEAQIINVDFINDLALLKVDYQFKGQIQIAQDLPEKGGELYSLGLPEDLDWSVVKGIFNGLVHRGAMDLFYMSTPINRGMSGGPIVNNKNELVAVNESMQIFSSQISFGVPLAAVKAFLAEPISKSNQDKKFFLKKLESQLTVHQNILTEKMEEAFKSEKVIGGVSTPDLSKYLKCWGDTENQKENKFQTESEVCSNEFQVEINSAYEGVFRTQASVTDNLSMNPFAWQKLISSKAKVLKQGQVDRFDSKFTLNFKPLRCLRENVKHNDSYLTTTVCYQNIIEFPDLFDFYISIYKPINKTKFLDLKIHMGAFTKQNLQKILNLVMNKRLESKI